MRYIGMRAQSQDAGYPQCLANEYLWNFQDENMKKSGASKASRHRAHLERIAELGTGRGETLGRMRSSSRSRPEVVESGRDGHSGLSHDGIICTGESYKKVVKLTSPRRVSEGSGPSLQLDLDGNVRRAITSRRRRS